MMKQLVYRSVFALGVGWAAVAGACTADPYTATICAMAWTAHSTASFQVSDDYLIDYFLANGQQINGADYLGLYTLIGNTYGGTSYTNMQLPNLQGRFILGDLTSFRPGSTGGATTQTLSISQMPAHIHALDSTQSLKVTTGLGNLSINTQLAGLSATTGLAGQHGRRAVYR